MGRLKWCPDGSASTAWDYAGLLYKFYSLGCRDPRDAGPKRCHYSETSRVQSPPNPSVPRGQHFPPPPSLQFLMLPFFTYPLSPPTPPPLWARALGATIRDRSELSVYHKIRKLFWRQWNTRVRNARFEHIQSTIKMQINKREEDWLDQKYAQTNLFGIVFGRSSTKYIFRIKFIL